MLRELWRARCRWHLAKHRPVRVITGMEPLGLAETATTGTLSYAITSQFHRCDGCGVRLNEDHYTLREVEDA